MKKTNKIRLNWLIKHIGDNGIEKYSPTYGGPKLAPAISGKARLKAQAHAAMRGAIAMGTLVRPSKCKYHKSGSCSGQIEGYHYLGYEPEHWLDVEWLCHRHRVREAMREKFKVQFPNLLP